MTLMIRNIEYFKWEVPDEIVALLSKNKSEQNLIDEFFNPDDISVDQISDNCYEYSGTFQNQGGAEQ